MAAFELQVNTGAVEIELKDEFNDVIGVIRFVPTDMDILPRLKKTIGNIENIKVDESMDGAENIEFVNKSIREMFDYIFNAPVSKEIFAKCTPTTLLQTGKTFAYAVLEGLLPYLEDLFKERIESAKKIEEATKDYQ